MTREYRLAVAAAGVALVAALGLGGWAAASAPHHIAASDGRVLEVRYEVRREPTYVPPAATEATRLDVLSAQPATVAEDGVLSAQAGDALRSVQAEDAARTTAALEAIRAQDARIDREAAAAVDNTREAAPAETSTPA